MQQQNMQNQQPVMQQPPNTMTTKDHLYIKDMLSWNLLAMKKAHFYASMCTDQQIKVALDQAGKMHQMHYQKILKHMGTHTNQNAQFTQQQQQQQGQQNQLQ